MLSRLDLTLKKLILLFTINDRTDHPTAEAVERAIQLYDYLRMTYMIFSTDIAHSDFEECRMKLIEVILALKQATGQPPTMRQIGQRIGNKFSRQLVLQVIKTMTELDELQEEITSNQKGPKTVRYSYVAAD
jgi:predicted hydrocarbon binding protein